LRPEDTDQAVAVFGREFGAGVIKLFGGEPLLAPDVVRHVMDQVVDLPWIRRVYLSTNGLGLTSEWIDYLKSYPKAVLTVSLDGSAGDNRRFRRPMEGVADAYDRVVGLMPELVSVPRVVVTQTIPPATAHRAFQNFKHLHELGFWRFNLLPGYYIPWRARHVESLRGAFARIGSYIEDRWENDERFYLRNLFTFQPTAFFNTGMIVDADRTIHPSNVGLSSSLDDLLQATRVGDLDNPPSREELEARAASVNGLLESRLPKRVLASTAAVDSELTRLCESLYPAYLRYRTRRREAA